MSNAEYWNNVARGRSREGAWIEILCRVGLRWPTASRSREGAWIEIHRGTAAKAILRRRSREGAWIEIMSTMALQYAARSLPRGSVD